MCNSIKPIAIIVMICLFISCNEKINFPDGGYNYPASPYKTIKDSFNFAYYSHYWCLAYNEPDMNIKPLNQTTFRLIYETAFGKSVVFTMTANEIIIKQAIQGQPYPDRDLTKLDSLEKLHFQILRSSFPIQEVDSTNPQKGSLNSLVKSYPKLMDPNYYKSLLDKSAKADSLPFKYITKRVSISDSLYTELLLKINSSGYWQLPPHIECGNEYLDGYGFILEANTKKKYNYVGLANCPEKSLSFSKACQAIIDAAGWNKEIEIVPGN